MPPKTKKGKSKAPKKASVSLDDIDTTVFTREKLEEYCSNVYKEIEKEREHSEFLRLDRDKLENMVAIAREQLTNARDAIRTKQHELQFSEDKHRITMWENRQKLIHLLSEKNIDCLNTKLESVNKVNLEQINHEERMKQILSDINELKSEIKSLEIVYSEVFRKEEIGHAENKSQIRAKDKNLHILMESKREKTYTNKLKELELKYDLEYKYLEKLKNKEISNLIKTNIKFNTDLKHYYNQIVNHNLSVINMMKSEFQHVKTKTAAIEKQCLQLKQENNFLVTSLSQSKVEEVSLRKKLAPSGKDKSQLKYIKTALETNKNKLEQNKIELEVLNMRLEKEKQFMEDSISQVNDSLTKIKVTREEVILLLQFIITHLYHRNKEADAILSKIKTIFLEKGKWINTLDSITDFQNTLLDEMNFQIATVAQDRDRIVNAYKDMLSKYHLHMDDTGFNPLTANDILKSAVTLRVLVNDF